MFTVLHIIKDIDTNNDIGFYGNLRVESSELITGNFLMNLALNVKGDMLNAKRFNICQEALFSSFSGRVK